MTSRFIQSLIFSSAIVCSIGSAAEAASMNYTGGWSNAVVYKPGSVVVYNNGIYYSLKGTRAAPNRAYIPSTNPTWWQQVGTIGRAGKGVVGGHGILPVAGATMSQLQLLSQPAQLVRLYLPITRWAFCHSLRGRV